MPYTGPHISANGGLISQDAAQTVGSNISKMLQRYHDEKKKREFNQGVYEYLSQQTDSEGNPYIPVETLGKWNSMNPDAQAGVLSLAAAKAQEDMAAKNRERQNLDLSDAEVQRANDAGVVPLRQSRGSFEYRSKPGSDPNAGYPEIGTPAYDADGTAIGVYEAKGRIKTTGSKAKQDPMAKLQQQMRQDEISSYDEQITRMQGEIAKGEKKYGPDWNPFATSYEDHIRDLQIKKARAQQAMGAPAAGSDAQPAPATGTAATAPVQIASDADYNALPSGTIFIDPDGKRRRKP